VEHAPREPWKSSSTISHAFNQLELVHLSFDDSI
jgi:hypothetical protein